MSSPIASSSTRSSASCRGGARLTKTLSATQLQHRSSPRHILKPGPLGLGKSEALDGSNTLSGLRKQQFRQKCQDAMAKDRKLDRGRKIAKSREHRSTAGTDTSSDDDDGGQTKMVMYSDDLSSSDVDEETREEREMEMARRVLAVDYRRMMREQERSGQIEVGWLDPDEVAWLEEEMKREEAQAAQQDLEPPADMFDEDEELFAQYKHAQSRFEDDDSEDDFSWLNEEDWQRAIEGAERRTQQFEIPAEDVVMSDD